MHFSFISKQAKTLLLLALFFTGMALLSLLSVQRLEHRAALTLAEQTSSLLVNAMNLMRVSYSEEVVAKVREQTKLSIGPGHLTVSDRVPNPATFAIELGDKLSDSEAGFIIRLYSHFPFPNRQRQGGPQDAFERKALEYLENHPDQSFMGNRNHRFRLLSSKSDSLGELMNAIRNR